METNFKIEFAGSISNELYVDVSGWDCGTIRNGISLSDGLDYKRGVTSGVIRFEDLEKIYLAAKAVRTEPST